MYAAMKMLERKLLYVLIAVPWFFLLHIVLFIKLERIFFEDYSKHFSDRNKKEGGVRVCGIAVLRYFWCGVAVIFISNYGIAVFRVQAVCGKFKFHVAVVGEKLVASR